MTNLTQKLALSWFPGPSSSRIPFTPLLVVAALVVVSITETVLSLKFANGNGFVGIAAVSGGHSIRDNTANGNFAGIVLFNGSTGNTVKGNTALTNLFVDLFDENANCDSNMWTSNVFNTANQACIH